MENKRGNWWSNMAFLIAPFWQEGKLFTIGHMAVSLLLLPLLAYLDVRLLQTVIDALTAGLAINATLQLALQLVTAKFLLTITRWSFLLLYDRWKVVEIQNRINLGLYTRAMATDYRYFDSAEFYNNYTFASGELATKATAAVQLLSDTLATIATVVVMSAYLASVSLPVVAISVSMQLICLYAQLHIQQLGIQKATAALPYERRLHYVHRVAYQKQYAADLKSTELRELLTQLFTQSGAGRVEVFRQLALPNWRYNIMQFSAWHLGELLQLVLIIRLAYSENISLGAVSALFVAASRLSTQLNQFVSLSGRAMDANLYSLKIQSFFNTVSTIETQEEGLDPGCEPFALELDQVSFSYPDSSTNSQPGAAPKAVSVLDHISLTIKPGEKIALVGENGAGKTTLAKLLLRLYDPQQGVIRLNGEVLTAYNPRQLRHRIGVAFQEPQLYAMSVAANLSLYGELPPAAQQEALELVGLVAELASSVTREFDDQGLVFSGGQGQKLALARLLGREFGLLLLDEPSSSLDPLAEYAMTQLIFNQATTTTIMVAHRLSTVRNADRIYLLSGGQLLEWGSHEELMALGGKYAEMFTKQGENYAR